MKISHAGTSNRAEGIPEFFRVTEIVREVLSQQRDVLFINQISGAWIEALAISSALFLVSTTGDHISVKKEIKPSLPCFSPLL